MRKSFKLIVSLLIILTYGISTHAQDKEEYKDVLLDGKPAKLNIVTGVITLIKLEDSTIETKKDSLIAKPILVTDAHTIGASPQSKATDNGTISFHTVKEGETLLDISKNYQLSLTDLMRINKLETTLVNKGQRLRVTDFEADTDTKPLSEANNDKNNTSNFHIVKKGETLFGLSRRYKLSVTELKNKNNLNTTVINVGQKLRVRDFGLDNDIDNVSVWTVKKGDTLFSIAKRSGIAIDAIKKLNNLTSNIIMIGQILQLK